MSRKSYNVVSIIYYQTSSPKMKSRIWKVWAAPRKTQIFALLGGLIMWSFVNQTLNSTHFEYTDYILRLHCVFTAQTEFSAYSRWRYIGLGNFIFILGSIFQSTTRSEPCQISKMEYFAKIVNGLKLLIVFEKLHLRYSRGFWIILWC